MVVVVVENRPITLGAPGHKAHFALARLYDLRGYFSDAVAHLRKAHSMKRASGYDFDSDPVFL
eukprot:8046811-Pyramimonas_sp.AAC.1